METVESLRFDGSDPPRRNILAQIRIIRQSFYDSFPYI